MSLLAERLALLLTTCFNALLQLRFLTLAASTCLIYDHCVTFEEEVSIQFLPVTSLTHIYR